jgi:hypothetical protein
MPWRAFDKTVSRKPLAFAVDAVYGNSIDLGLEAIGKKGVAGKAWLLMQCTAPVVHPGLLAAPVLLSSAETLAPMHEAASAAQALRANGLFGRCDALSPAELQGVSVVLLGS